MKFILVFAVIVATWAAGVLTAARTEQGTQQATSTWSGVYTEEQAALGQETYTKHCSECHGQDLGGDGFAPSLKGPDFMNNWNGLTLGELFDRIRISMPPSDPNIATSKEKADILAYLLKQDGFPAGTTELAASVDALKAIKFEATKPGR